MKVASPGEAWAISLVLAGEFFAAMYVIRVAEANAAVSAVLAGICIGSVAAVVAMLILRSLRRRRLDKQRALELRMPVVTGPELAQPGD